jgi:hypothetical protein
LGFISKTYATIGRYLPPLASFLVPRVANARNMPRQNRLALNIALDRAAVR